MNIIRSYLSKLVAFQNSSVIKVITGIRRSGKSTLMQQFRDHLLENEGATTPIISINFESLRFDHIKNHQDLYTYVSDHYTPGTTNYILLDEVQWVENWERAITSFQVDLDCDIYITGSNAWLLSSEISTLLSGRYVEIHILPLSFSEYLSAQDRGSREEAFADYLKYGGFPGTLEFVDKKELIREYLDGVYNTVIVKDVIKRSQLIDVDLMSSLLSYLTDNIGNLVSGNKIADYLTSNGRKTSTTTLLHYLDAFEKAFIFYRARRYSIRGKRLLRSLDKFYVVDLGLRAYGTRFLQSDMGRMLENIVYLELVRRGYTVAVGTDRSFEVDFVATRDGHPSYFQVSLSITDPKVLSRELKGLNSIRDQYPKYLLTMDFTAQSDYGGIRHINIIDFLLSEPTP